MQRPIRREAWFS